jgi:cytochrome b involved in lipid metabolism
LLLLQEHGSVRDCWVALDGGVYDVTKFLEASAPAAASPRAV